MAEIPSERELAKEGEYVGGREHGVWAQWNPTGELLGTYELAHGSGTKVSWNDDGTKASESSLVDGVLHGAQTSWYGPSRFVSTYEKGVHVSDRKYVQDRLAYVSEFDGASLTKSTSYSADGKIQEIEVWKDGALVSRSRATREQMWLKNGALRTIDRNVQGDVESIVDMFVDLPNTAYQKSTIRYRGKSVAYIGSANALASDKQVATAQSPRKRRVRRQSMRAQKASKK